MFEEMTYKTILNRALDRVSSDYDKRQGSIIYDALAPACAELAQMYIDLNFTFNNFFVESMTEENVIKRVEEIGIERKEATKAVVLAEITGTFILDGTERFNCDDLNFLYMNDKQGAYYKLECETSGTIGNITSGTLMPIQNVQGLESANIVSLYEEGTDEESIADLKTRYYTKIQKPSTSGNKYDYYNWAMKVDGVGGCKVVPLWNGNGTVKVVICNANKGSAGQELINDVFDYIEEERPIGASVTVVSAREKSIGVTAKISITNAVTLQEVKDNFETALTKYFEKVAFYVEKISLSKVQNILFNIEGLEDYTELKLNDVSANVELEDDEIAVLGSLEFEVIT